MIPRQMIDAPRWILWRLETRNDQPTKVPYDAKTLAHAKTNDPTTWCDYDTAATVLRSGGGFTGLGFVLGDGFAGVDLDGCLDGNGNYLPWASTIVRKLNSYTETSPSGTGVKVFIRATLEKGHKKLLGSPVDSGKAPGIEIYGKGRYFAVTGETTFVSDDCEDRQEQLDAIIADHWPQRSEGSQKCHKRVAATDASERAAKYMALVEPAVSGQRGHDVTFRAACALVLGFGLSIDEALPLLAAWNERCQPPWSESELLHKLNSANQQGGDRGYLLRDNRDDGPQVDLSGFLGIATEPVELGQVFAETLPDDVLCPPGFLGELIKHNLQTAWFQQPALALAGALALLATLTGGKICDDSGTRTNLYLMGLAPSRSGKEHARKVNREICIKAGCEDLLGPEEIGSHAAIYSWLAEHPTMLFQLDEIGRKFATMQDAKKSPHLWNIVSVWLKLWSSSDSMLKGDAYADIKKTKTLLYPHAVIYGTSVPDSVWGNLTQENVSDGLLARFLIFEGIGYSELQANKSKKNDTAPDGLIQIARAWRELKTHDGNLNSIPCNGSPLKLATSDEARQRWESHNEAVVERRRTEDETTAAVWSGTPEKTAKLAMLFAASRWTGDASLMPIIELDDMDRAVCLANHLTRLMLDRASRHVAESETDKHSKIVLEAIRKLGNEATGDALCRATQRLNKRQRDDALTNLVQCQKLTTETIKTATKPKTVFRITQLRDLIRSQNPSNSS